MDLAVVDPASGECVGEIVLNDWEPGNQTCNLRILIGPRGRGRGLGTEAIRLLLDYAFAQTDLFRIELEVYSFNTRAPRTSSTGCASTRSPCRCCCRTGWKAPPPRTRCRDRTRHPFAGLLG